VGSYVADEALFMEKSDDCEDDGVRVGLEDTTGGEDFGLVERDVLGDDEMCDDWVR
jgi:hypothetical protein